MLRHTGRVITGLRPRASFLSRSLSTTSQPCEDGYLYDHSDARNVRISVFATFTNLTYWGFNTGMTIFENIFRNDVSDFWGVFQGAELNTAMLMVSGGFVYFSYQYAVHSIYRFYETADRGRLGFQLHNILGFPGRCIEVPKGNTQLVTSSNNTSAIGVRVEGLGKNLVFSNADAVESNPRIKELIEESKAAVNKDQRLNWRKNIASTKRKGNNTKD